MRVRVKNNNKIVFVKSKITLLSDKITVQLNDKDEET